MLPVPTKDYLAVFTGRDISMFTEFADQALTQATLLFSIVTKLDEYPAETDKQQLAINAILQMADQVYLQMPYATVKASPFASETIGSYSYSKATTLLLTKARQGEYTGLFWWDLAVEELSTVTRSLVMSGSIGMANPDIWTEDATGREYVLGPADLTYPDVPYDVNAEKSPRDPL